MHQLKASLRMSDGFVLRPIDRYNPPIHNKQVRDREVGDFFAGLTTVMFGGHLLAQTGVPSPDAHLKVLDAYAEIKGRNDAYMVLLKEDQLLRYLEIDDSKERASTFVYIIWRYQSQSPEPDENGQRKHRLTLVGKRRQPLRRFLANTAHSCHIFDIGVIEAVRQALGTKDHIWPSYETTPAVNLPVKFIYALHDGKVDEVKRALRRYRSVSLPVQFLYEDTVMSFTIHATVLPRTYRRLLKITEWMNGQLFSS